MHEPNYEDYSLEQLHDCLNHINRDKYPDRFLVLKKEITLRTHKGECFSDPALDELIPTSIPYSLGFRVWWSFTWRIILAGGLLLFLLNMLAWINVVYHLVLPETVLIFKIIAMGIFIFFCGPFFMMQALAKRYPDYRVRIVKLKN